MVRFVQAGAGAGKTTNLTQEVVKFAKDYYAKESKWPRVVLTTFTRKATQELKERILRYCLEREPALLAFVQSPTQLNITTMHGLLSQFLSQKGSFIGLPSSFELEQGQESAKQRKRILHSLIQEGEVPAALQSFGFARLLTAMQQTEVFHLEGGMRPPEMVDFEIVARKVHSQFAGQWREIFDTWTWPDSEAWQKAHRDIQVMLETLCLSQPWQIKRDSLARQIDDLEIPRSSKKVPGLSKDQKDELTNFIGKIGKWIQAEEFDPSDWPRQSALLNSLHRLGRSYTQRLTRWKIQEALLETDDLELLSLRLVEEVPGAAADFAAGIQAWFIDEFQDTSPRQLRILEPLMQGSNVYYVGDPQQSIYLFRGSRSEVFHQQAAKIESQGGRKDYLDTNYRSEAPVLGFINHFFTGFSQQFRPMIAGHATASDKAQVKLATFEPGEEELELSWLTSEIGDLLNSGVRPKEICLLTRTRKDLEALQKLLLAQGFPVLSHASAQFYQRREIVDALALLQFLINPADDRNLITLLRSPWLGVPDQMIADWSSDKESSLWLACQMSMAQAPQGLRTLADVLKEVSVQGLAVCFRRGLHRLGLFEFALAADPSGRAEANLSKLVNLVERNSRKPGLSFQQLSGQTGGAVDLTEGGAETDASSPVEPDKINLMTVHGSKGLQFEHVFLPFLAVKNRQSTWQDVSQVQELGLWSVRLPKREEPSFAGDFLEALALEDLRQRESEESLRVLYVAMTRAKKSLRLSWVGPVKDNSWAGLVEHALPQMPSQLYSRQTSPVTERMAWGETYKVQDPRSPYQLKAPEVGVRDLLTDLPSPMDPFKILQRRHWGILSHRLFEGLKYHTPEHLEESLRVWGLGEGVQIKQALTYLRELTEPPILSLIRSGEVEWPFVRRSADGFQQGRIDLWCCDGKRLWVVDYKTGSLDYLESAMQQMGLYAEVLKKELAWSGPTSLVAVYPFSQQTVVREFLHPAEQ